MSTSPRSVPRDAVGTSASSPSSPCRCAVVTSEADSVVCRHSISVNEGSRKVHLLLSSFDCAIFSLVQSAFAVEAAVGLT